MFLDRIQSQEEIHKLVEEVFADKQKLNFEDYQKVIQENTSEMFLSIMILL